MLKVNSRMKTFLYNLQEWYDKNVSASLDRYSKMMNILEYLKKRNPQMGWRQCRRLKDYFTDGNVVLRLDSAGREILIVDSWSPKYD